MTGLLLGIVGSVIPRLLTYWQESMDFKREIIMMKLQAELDPPAPTPEVLHIENRDLRDARQKDLLMANKVQGVLGNIVRALISVVRPTVTFGVIGIWGAWKIMSFSAGNVKWEPWEVDMLFFTVTYYFGQRGIRRNK